IPITVHQQCEKVRSHRHLGDLALYHQSAFGLRADLFHRYTWCSFDQLEPFWRNVENTEIAHDLLHTTDTCERKTALLQQFAFAGLVGVHHHHDDVLGAAHEIHRAAHAFHHFPGDLPIGYVAV